MRKACRGMLFAAGLLLMGTETAWAQTDTTAPTVSGTGVSGVRLNIVLSEAMNGNSPAPTDFAVSFDSTSVDVASIAIAGGTDRNRWNLTLAAYAAPGESVSVTYTKPSSNPPQDTAGNDLASFTETPPNASTWSSHTTTDAFTSTNGKAIVVNFTVAMTTTRQPDLGRFSATVDGVAADLTSVALRNPSSTGGKGQLILGSALPIQQLQSVTVSYNRLTGATNSLVDGTVTAKLLQDFTRAVANKVGQPTPSIDVVRIVSAPTYDADGDGVRDTFVRGDKILADVEYSVPVTVTGTPRLRLQLGADGTTGAPVVANRKQMNFESKLHGGVTLRFAYTVAAADSDSDGVWIETAGSNKTVVFLPGGANITLADTSTQAELTRTGLPTTGEALAKVDGTKTATDTGPRPTGATVNGSRLEVTYNRALDTSVDTSKLPLYFEVSGTELSGGHRNAYQHPSTVAFATGDNTKLVLTLGDPARAGDTVTLSYTLIDQTGPLEDTNDKMAPAFFVLAVTNNTAGTAGPAPSRASVRVRTLRLVFDGDLDEASTPAGSAFLVETDDLNGDKRSIAGTGTATVAGATVTVALDANEELVGANDLVRVSYTPPTSNPLQNAGGDDVLAFERFRVETVLDGTAPADTGLAVWKTQDSPVMAGVVVYFDEALDASSVPAGGDFSVTVNGTAANVSSVAIAGLGVTMMIDNYIASSHTQYALSYTPGTNPIRDAAGNSTASFTRSTQSGSGSFKPVFNLPSVDGSLLQFFGNSNLDPSSTPAPGAFALHYPLAAGETEAEEYSNDITGVEITSRFVRLRLAYPVRPCATSFTLTYTKPSDSPITDITGAQADGFTKRAVTNRRASQCTRSQVTGNSGGSGQGRSMTLSFDRTLDTDRALKASAFRLAGAAAPAVAGASYADDASGVVLALGRALRSGEAVTVSYERAERDPGLWDTEGNQIADFSGVTVTNEEPAVPAVSVSDARAAEGEAVEFTVSLSEASDEQVTVDYATSDGTAESGTDFTAGSGTLTFSANDTSETVRVETADDSADEEDETFTLTLSNPAGATLDDAEATGTIEDDDGALAALTAAFHGMPAEHDGGRLFSFEIRFSEEFEGLRLTALEAGALEVTGGRLLDVKRTTRGENRSVTARVRPVSSAAVTVSLAATTDCSASTAICARDGRMLSNAPSATVSGPGEVQPAANSPATGAPTIAGTPRVGETLEASAADIEDADGLSGAAFSYQWLSNDAEIAGATGASYTLADADEGATVKVRVTFTDDAGNEETRTSGATEAVAPRLPPLTASFRQVPAEHDGNTFTFRVRFSEDPAVSFRVLRDEAFTVTGGTVLRAKRVNDRNDLREIHVEPSGFGAVSITLPATTNCDAAGAICTSDGRPLSNSNSASVVGPVGISVADARVEEGVGATLAFAVTLSRAATSAFGVDYATADGSALAGEDYTAASGTLSFQAGESSATIKVVVLDDAHDEGEETLTLRLSNSTAGRLTDGEATGTIVNADLMPAALLARFGRATAEQVVDQVEERMAAPRQGGFRARLAGREYRPGMEGDFARGFLSAFALTGTGAAGAAPAGGATLGGAATTAASPHLAGAFGADTTGLGGALGVSGRQPSPGGASGSGLLGSLAADDDLLSRSEFELNRASHGGVLSVWSRSSRSSFAGMEEALSLNGDVRTTMVGADWARGPLTVGLSVGHTRGGGGYTGRHAGAMTTAMTGFYPWLGYRVNDRVSVWAVTGYGKGSLSLTPDGAGALETGMSMAMTAVGTRGELLGSRAAGGFGLAFKADALWVGATSELLDGPAGRLNASEAGATRVRTALEGSRGFTLGGDRVSLTPSVEVGLRRDGGDAETGAGLDLGGGLVFTDTVMGVSLDVRVRTLVMHQSEGFAERGMSLSLGWDPTPSSPLGLSARVAPSWGGQTMGGAEALWGGQMAYGSGSQQFSAPGGQLNAEVGYGLPVGARFVGTPRVGVMRSPHGREYRAGYGLGLLESGSLHLDLGLDAQRRVSAMPGGPDNGFLLRATLGW